MYDNISKRGCQVFFIFLFYRRQCSVLLNGHPLQELRFLTLIPVWIDLQESTRTFVAFATLRGPDVTLKISTLSFFAVLLRRPK